MMNEIQAEYAQVIETGNVEWNDTDPCCVKCPRDGLWYRASILKIPEDREYFKVCFLISSFIQYILSASRSVSQCHVPIFKTAAHILW